MVSRKVISVIAIAAVILPQCAVSSCSRKDNKDSKIYSEDIPWYTVSCSDLLNDFEDSGAEQTISSYLGECNGNLVFAEEASYPVPDNADWTASCSSQYSDSLLVICDNDLNRLSSVDLEELFASEGIIDPDNESFSLYDVSYATDEGIFLDFFLNGTSSWGEKLVVLDPTTLDVISSSDRDNEMFYSLYGADEHKIVFGNGNVLGVGLTNDAGNCSVVIGLYDESGDVHFTDLSDVFPMVGIYGIYDPIMTDADHAVAKLKTYGESEEYWIGIDLENYTVTSADGDMSYLDGVDLSNIDYSDDFGSVSVSTDGLKKIDVASGTVEEIFSFDWCNINRNLINDVQLISIDEESVIMFVTVMRLDRDGKVYYDSTLMDLHRCDTNPNVGKTILTVACLGEMTYVQAQAICDFNETNEEYFLTVDSSYNANDYGNYTSISVAAALDDSMVPETAGMFTVNNDPALNDYYLNSESNMSSALTVDLISGEGPDIILDGAGYSQLNNDQYLMDLNGYYSDSGIECLSNIMDVSRTGDKLYQIPLTFIIYGMEVSASAMTDGQTGFTFEQYGEYVSGPCNGTDPMMMSRLDFLTAVISAQSDMFISGSDVNFDNEAFRAAAEYAKDHVYDQSYDEYADYSDEGVYTGYRELTGLSDVLIGTDLMNGNGFLGIPSSDGRGPVIGISSSAAISAQTDSPDGCWQFIEMLLSKDKQEEMAVQCMPVRSDAFDAVCEADLETYTDYYNYWTEEERREIGVAAPDEASIPLFKEIIGTADRINTTDSPVMIIMREEIQAYFAGDKSLDEVIGIINSRAQTYYDERS